MSNRTAIIIGAGPAGLTAAYELLTKTDIVPIVFEETDTIGGIARTANYKGNRIDIGGHRFFSKSDTVMSWWTSILPEQGFPSKDDKILARTLQYSKEKDAPDPEKTNLVMLIRRRLSRIFYLRKFFDYPVSLNAKTFKNLGFMRIMKIGFSYIFIKIFSIKNEKSLEDFFINRFGRELYKTFFKDYTEKVWGFDCSKISKEFGVQRVKGLSLIKTVLHAIKSIFTKNDSIQQKNIETSLIEQFLYPKLGPGQMWEEVARQIQLKGGKVLLKHKAVGLVNENDRITSVSILNVDTGKTESYSGDFIFSTMPVRDLIASLKNDPPENVRNTARGLIYRDFITVGLLLKKLKIKNETTIPTVNNIVPDNWIYIQERDVKVGRLQIFNNWSPYMVADDKNVWIGLEYFCNEGDELWYMSDKDFSSFAIGELIKIDIIEKDDVLDNVVIRVPKTYPAYFGTYGDFHLVKEYVSAYRNLYLIGRNGMHRYNNMDHSMLTAITAVENIINKIESKENIWAVNTEEEYHESKDDKK
jgi:protoporphyrinogen oxidase